MIAEIHFTAPRPGPVAEWVAWVPRHGPYQDGEQQAVQCEHLAGYLAGEAVELTGPIEQVLQGQFLNVAVQGPGEQPGSSRRSKVVLGLVINCPPFGSVG